MTELKTRCVLGVVLIFSLSSHVLAQDVAPDTEDTALVMARCVADEVGPDLPKKWSDYQKRINEQTAILWALHNGWQDVARKKPELTLSQYTKNYCTIYTHDFPSRKWLRELPADGATKPEHFPKDDRWSEYAPRWRALLDRVRAWLGPCGAELVKHWHGPGSKPHDRLQVARCSTFGKDRNVLFVVLTPRQAKRRAEQEEKSFRERMKQWGLQRQEVSLLP